MQPRRAGRRDRHASRGGSRPRRRGAPPQRTARTSDRETYVSPGYFGRDDTSIASPRPGARSLAPRRPGTRPTGSTFSAPRRAASAARRPTTLTPLPESRLATPPLAAVDTARVESPRPTPGLPTARRRARRRRPRTSIRCVRRRARPTRTIASRLETRLSHLRRRSGEAPTATDKRGETSPRESKVKTSAGSLASSSPKDRCSVASTSRAQITLERAPQVEAGVVRRGAVRLRWA